MATVNQQIFDQIIRRQIYLERYKRGVINLMSPILNAAINDVRLKIGKLPDNATKAQLNNVLREITSINKDLSVKLYDELTKEMQAYAKQESRWTGAMLQSQFPQALKIKLGLPSEAFLARMVETQPFQGLVLQEWTNRIGQAASLRARQQLFIGLAEGESVDKLAKRMSFIGEQMKNDATMVVRTAVTAINNQAKNAVYQENSDVISKVRWTSTLDSKTSEICQARDGEEWDVDEDHPSPPAHPNCRSVLVPIIKSLQELGLSNVKLSASTRASMDGQVPDDETYNTWLRKQPEDFVKDVLGPTKADAYLNGGLSLDKFVDDFGHVLTLAELEAKYPNAF